MKLNRKQLRKLIIKEAKQIINESATVVDDLEAFYDSVKKMAVQLGLSLSPIGMATTYLTHKAAIDAAYKKGGKEEASRVFLRYHQQLAKDVSQPALDTLETFVQSFTDSLE